MYDFPPQPEPAWGPLLALALLAATAAIVGWLLWGTA